MKKMILTALTSILLFSFSQEVKAHPGNTDSFGKHTCRTNCGKWGLEYGDYHGHVGGSGSSSYSSSGDSTDSTYSDDDSLMTEQELEINYEELQNEGYQIGFQDGYTDKEFVDFDEEMYSKLSNADYSWYEVGYEKGYKDGKEQRVNEIIQNEEADSLAGEKLGYEQGRIDFNNKTVKKTLQTDSTQTKYWVIGYTEGYNKAVEVMNLAVQAKDEGYLQGLIQEEMSVPSHYSSEYETKVAFEEGFIKGNDERINKLQESYKKEGYDAGFNQLFLPTRNDVPELFMLSFKNGYEMGNRAKEDEAYQQGYNLAFNTTKYQMDNQYKDYTNLQKQHQDGFEANKVAIEIREEAFEVGKSGKSILIPEKLKSNMAAVMLYKSYYKKGKERKEFFHEKILLSGVITVPTGLVGGYYLHRRKLKKRKV
jgi:hypothetical protein